MNTSLFHKQTFSAFLFDMDGTLLTSVVAAERVWASWATRHGIDLANFLPTIHGVRAIDTIRRVALPGMDIEAEAEWVTQAEIADVEGIEEIAGARRFLLSLPPARWAIVTSAPHDLAMRRIEAAGIPIPPVVVTADDVKKGKPAPDCFLLAAKRLDVEPRNCLVFEDSPAGVKAGEEAGANVLVISATHQQPMKTPHPNFRDYSELEARTNSNGLTLLTG